MNSPLEVFADATAFIGALGALLHLLDRYANLPLKIQVERRSLKRKMKEFELDRSPADEEFLEAVTSEIVPRSAVRTIRYPRPSEVTIVERPSPSND